MKPKLKIRNFGPINDLDIEISKFNILIGPHASGKSTISKVLCIIHMFDFRILPVKNDSPNIESLKVLLAYYRIENFISGNTYWFFESADLTFELKNSIPSIKYHGKDYKPHLDSYYFPAERIALPMISESIFELNLNDSSLPKYFLKFGRDFMIAKKEQKTFNLPLLNVEFEYADGKNTVILSNSKSILLEETSSAIQANLPLLVILNYPIRKASLFVIEELELHNYPELQKKLLYYLVKKMQSTKLMPAYVILPTHSPYLLSAANNLLFAAKVGNQTPSEVDNIINKASWINKDDFSAYYVIKGHATSIVDNETGMIHENMLDTISDELADEFNALMDLYKPTQV